MTQWWKLMGAVPLAVTIAACSSNRSNPDSATSAGVLSTDSTAFGLDTNPAKRAGSRLPMDSTLITDTSKARRDSAYRDTTMLDSMHKGTKTAKKSSKKPD